MVQVKKDDVRQRIDEAALKVFAGKGFEDAKISHIAKRAGVSVGNIYRYYKNKDEILLSVLPGDFPGEFLRMIREKIGSAQDGLSAGSPAFETSADAFARYMLSHREKIAILLAGSGGTRYAPVKDEFAKELLLAVRILYPEKYAAYIERYGSEKILFLIYENLISAYGALLIQECPDEEIMRQIKQVNRYHFSGIISLLEI
jgi:AcrR family transcriptional regulator